MAKPYNKKRDLNVVLGQPDGFNTLASQFDALMASATRTPEEEDAYLAFKKQLDEGKISQADLDSRSRRLLLEMIFNSPNVIGRGPRDLAPASMVFSSYDDPAHELPPGFYLVTGGSGSGKSITMASLAAAVFAQQKVGEYDVATKADKVLVRYSYMYEARGPDLSKPELGPSYFISNVRNSLDIKATGSADIEIDGETLPAASWWARRCGLTSFFQSAVAARAQYTTKLEAFETEADRAKKDVAAEAVPTAKLWIIDSVSLPLRQYAPTAEGRRGEATMSGGLQPSDVDFVVQMEAIAVAANLVICGIVNTDLVPFVDQLEGVTEGLIQVTGPGMFSYRQRNSRKWQSVTLDAKYVAMGAEFLHYPPDHVDDVFKLTGYIAS